MMKFISFAFSVVFMLSSSGRGILKNNCNLSVHVAANDDIDKGASSLFRGYNDDVLHQQEDHHRSLANDNDVEDAVRVLEQYKTGDGLLSVQFLEPSVGEITVEVTTEDEKAMSQFLEIQENAGKDIGELYKALAGDEPKGPLRGAIQRLERNKRLNKRKKNSDNEKSAFICHNPFLANDDEQLGELGEEVVIVDIDDLEKIDEEEVKAKSNEDNSSHHNRDLRLTYGSQAWFGNKYCRFLYKNEWCSCRSSVWGYSKYLKEDTDDYSVLVYNSGPGLTVLKLYKLYEATGWEQVSGSPKYVYPGQIKSIHAYSGGSNTYISTAATLTSSTNYRIVRWNRKDPAVSCGSTKCNCGPVITNIAFDASP